MKAINIKINGQSLFDGFRGTGWHETDVKGFKFNLFNDPDTGGAVFQCRIPGTGNEKIKPGGKLEIEVK